MIVLWVFLGALVGSALGSVVAAYLVMRFDDE